MIHWTCDRCEAPTEGEPLTLWAQPPGGAEPAGIHLCGPCQESFTGWLVAARPVKPASATAMEPEPEANPKAEPETSPR